MVCDTPLSQDVPTQQIFNYYIKEYKSCASDSMLILENKSALKVTVTGKWNGTIYYSKMHSHTKGALAIRRIFSLVDMITKPKFSNCPNVFKTGLFRL